LKLSPEGYHTRLRNIFIYMEESGSSSGGSGSGGCGGSSSATVVGGGDDEAKPSSCEELTHRVTEDLKNVVLDVDPDDIQTNIDLVEDKLYLGKDNNDSHFFFSLRAT